MISVIFKNWEAVNTLKSTSTISFLSVKVLQSEFVTWWDSSWDNWQYTCIRLLKLYAYIIWAPTSLITRLWRKPSCFNYHALKIKKNSQVFIDTDIAVIYGVWFKDLRSFPKSTNSVILCTYAVIPIIMGMKLTVHFGYWNWKLLINDPWTFSFSCIFLIILEPRGKLVSTTEHIFFLCGFTQLYLVVVLIHKFHQYSLETSISI